MESSFEGRAETSHHRCRVLPQPSDLGRMCPAQAGWSAKWPGTRPGTWNDSTASPSEDARVSQCPALGMKIASSLRNQREGLHVQANVSCAVALSSSVLCADQLQSDVDCAPRRRRTGTARIGSGLLPIPE